MTDVYIHSGCFSVVEAGPGRVRGSLGAYVLYLEVDEDAKATNEWGG